MPHDTRDQLVDFVRSWSDKTEIPLGRFVGWIGVGASKFYDWKRRFGKVNAVDHVSFRAEKGKFVVLLGPSGCGKSTLLRLIAGLEEVSEGKIRVGHMTNVVALPGARIELASVATATR